MKASMKQSKLLSMWGDYTPPSQEYSLGSYQPSSPEPSYSNISSSSSSGLSLSEIMPQLSGGLSPVKEEEEEEEGRGAELPPAPPSSPASGDQVDSWFTGTLVRAVKTGLLHLLNAVVAKYSKDICNGCIISHPSQRQHSCLTINEDESFFRVHFEEISDRLFSSKFSAAIRHQLIAHGVKAEDASVKTIALTLLHELKTEKQIFTQIFAMYEDMGPEQLRILQIMSDSFAG